MCIQIILGVILKKLVRIEESIVNYEKAILLNPKNDAAYNNLGIH